MKFYICYYYKYIRRTKAVHSQIKKKNSHNYILTFADGRTPVAFSPFKWKYYFQ